MSANRYAPCDERTKSVSFDFKKERFKQLVGPFQDALVCKAVELALQGDQQMLDLLLKRILPE